MRPSVYLNKYLFDFYNSDGIRIARIGVSIFVNVSSVYYRCSHFTFGGEGGTLVPRNPDVYEYAKTNLTLLSMLKANLAAALLP